MDLKKLTLEEWFHKKAPKFKFPFGRNYSAMYTNTADHLYKKVHNEVNTGAILVDNHLLTDHGPEHIRTVISRASELVKAKDCDLSEYEVFILLSAIHLHDVGNIFGRENHEQRSREMQKSLGTLAATDDAERKVIYKIAEAHGGKPAHKLEGLPSIEHVLNNDVRMQLLGAILKFADELADDYSRASNQPWHNIPHKNQVFHKYSEILKSVKIDHDSRTVKLKFEINVKDAIQKFGKKNDNKSNDVYLIDEIFERTLKTHLERVFCMRFTIPYIRLDSVAVTIGIFDDDFNEIIEPIGYRLEEKGYPNIPQGLNGICPEVKCNGKSIKQEIRKKLKAK